MLEDGRFTGNLGHHAVGARYAFEETGIEYPRYQEIPAFIQKTGAIRTEASRRTGFNVQIEGDLTPAQLDSIAAVAGHYKTFTYDIHAPDGSQSSYGTSFEEFLNDSLVIEAFRHGKEMTRPE